MSDVTCRGSFALGTACGRCSRCRREIESYNAMKSVRDKLNTPSSAISRIEELEAQRKKTYEALLKVTQLEAKLAKAVDALVRIADTPSEMTWGVESEVREAMNGMEIIAETTLAQLTGGKDE